MYQPVLRIQNDLFRTWIQLLIFRVPDLDPDPGKSSGSNLYLLSTFRNNKKRTFNSIKKKDCNIYLPFSLLYYSPTVQAVQNSQFYLSAL